MISISARGPASEATKYYEHLQSEYGPADYYSSESAGRFTGAGLATLGLEADAPTNVEMFKALAEGRHPVTGAPLVQKAGEDHRAGWDVTLSPPKSVSTIWGLGDADTRAEIESAHQEAVARTLAYLEGHAAYTRRGGGWMSEADRREKIDGFIVARYQHGTSREADPQLHEHLMIFNLARRGDGSYGSIEARHIYQHQSAAGAIYDAALANEMQRRGYSIEREGRSFEAAGVPEELRREFSQRREQIEKELSERGASGSRASERATLATRRAKEARDIDSLREQWAERARALEVDWTPEQSRQVEAPALEPVPGNAEILRTLTEQRSTFSHRDVTALVGIAAIGTLTADQVERYAEQVLRDPEAVELTGHDGLPRYTTREMQQMESDMAARAQRMAQAESHGVVQERVQAALDARPTLTDEQRRAVEHVTAQGAVALVQGGAGTGKTFALAAAREAWEAEGFRIRGVALAGKAAEGLESGSGIQSGTLHSLLRDTSGETVQGIEYQARDPLRAGDIVVLDEAGMVGSRQLSELLARAEDAGAKVVMIGDARQLQAIDAGAAFRAIQERTGSVGLDDIRRQHTEADRQAVRDLRDGRAKEALENLRERGRVHEYKTARDAADAAGKAVVADLAGGQTSIAVASTRAEVRGVNESARAAALDAGLVSREGVKVETDAGDRVFSAGDRILLTRNDKALDVKNGDFGTVARVTRSGDAHARLTVRLDRGGEREIDTGKYSHIDHGYAATAHKLQGATLDRAHILASESRMSSREWAYVAGSRHRDEVHIHGERSTIQDLAPDWSQARQKDTSLDYRAREAPDRDHQGEKPMEPKQRDEQRADEHDRRREDASRNRPREADDRQSKREVMQPERKVEPKRAEQYDQRQGRGEPRYDYKDAGRAADTLKEYQAAADLHRQARFQERAAAREPDKNRAKEMRDSAHEAHARADSMRARAWRKEKELPREYRQEVRKSDRLGRKHEREAAKQEDRAENHYRNAGSALAKAQSPKTGLIHSVGAAMEYREEKWKAERAATAAKEAAQAGRMDRREGIGHAWDTARQHDHAAARERESFRDHDRRRDQAGLER